MAKLAHWYHYFHFDPMFCCGLICEMSMCKYDPYNSYWFELILQYVPSHYCTIVNNIAAQHVFMLS